MKKYIVIGGYVESKIDGDVHYINARRLCELYRVNPAECNLMETSEHSIGFSNPYGLIVLQPNYQGDYSLPTPPLPAKTKEE